MAPQYRRRPLVLSLSMWRPLVTGLAVALLGSAAPVAVIAAPPDEVPAETTAPDGSDTPDPSDTGGDPGTVTGGGDGGETTPGTLPLVPVPTGCTAPTLPHVVFLGTVDDRDYRTVRFEIEQIRAGRGEPFASGRFIDVRYGLDAQYLDEGETYLVAAVIDPDLGFLVSRVTEPTQNFGGDEVIGVSETDVSCPEYEDPMRTLHTDGTPIEASVIGPFLDAKVRIAGAFLVPFAVAFGVIFVLASLRLSVTGVVRSVSGARRRGPA